MLEARRVSLDLMATTIKVFIENSKMKKRIQTRHQNKGFFHKHYHSRCYTRTEDRVITLINQV